MNRIFDDSENHIAYVTKLHKASVELMFMAHKGQFRRDKTTPYVTHPLKLASMFTNYLDISVSLLHDAVEDGKLNGVDYNTISDMLCSIPMDNDSDHLKVEYILNGVSTLTHDIGDYKSYIQRIVGTPYVKHKIADITINLSDDPTDSAKEKYVKAMKTLLSRI